MEDRYAQLRAFYAEFRHHPEDARRVAWRCADDHLLRTEVLLEALRPEDYPCSVLDVGCGVGTLYGLLEATGRLGTYVGIDLLADMVSRARERHPGGQFEVADLLTWARGRSPDDRFDLVVCSGALNIKVRNHEQWVQRMLAAMAERARWAVAVNFQWTRAYKSQPVSVYDEDIYYAERPALLSWCEAVSPWLEMRQDYLGDEIAFYLYKDYDRTVRRLEPPGPHDPRPAAKHACGLAFLYIERRLYAQGLRVLQDAPETADVLNFRGLCHQHLGETRKARQCYEHALLLDPNLEAARLNLDGLLRE